jgi:hypothetical protein
MSLTKARDRGRQFYRLAGHGAKVIIKVRNCELNCPAQIAIALD